MVVLLGETRNLSNHDTKQRAPNRYDAMLRGRDTRDYGQRGVRIKRT